jgi:uncharacterized cupredoxin-like copper-binding protein
VGVAAVMGMGTVGMMGPGMGMMGPGMMGPGMGMMGMGIMSIRADRDSIKAGAVTFDVSNWSRSTIHELVLVSVDNSSTPLPYDYSQAKVREDQVKIVTETSELQPSQSASLQANLAPGSYLLICNIPGHYALGMATFLTVSP